MLESHIVGEGKWRYLCPICHSCLHLDVAGRQNAGRIIWLPELSQEELNLLCLSSFVAQRKAGRYRKDEKTKSMLLQIERLQKTFEKRAEAVELFLGAGAPRSPLPRHALSSPTFVASLIVRAARETKLAPALAAKRVEGLRLLPRSAAFDRYIGAVAKLVEAGTGVGSWMRVVEERHARAGKEAGGHNDAEHFDAEPAMKAA